MVDRHLIIAKPSRGRVLRNELFGAPLTRYLRHLYTKLQLVIVRTERRGSKGCK